MLITLSVEAKGAASFFQVIVVEASGVPAACSKAIASYAQRGYDDVRFDRAETAIIEADDVTLPRIVDSSDGIVAASERFWVVPARSRWHLPVRARAWSMLLGWPIGGLTLAVLARTWWPFGFFIPIWMIAIVIGSLTLQCERCGKNPMYPRPALFPRFMFMNPFFGSTCTFCKEPLDLEATPSAKSTHVERVATKSPFPYR